jgi:predicted phosphodiesterase
MSFMKNMWKNKLVCLGDIHGRSIWKDIVSHEKETNLFIFMGDYFDSHNKGYSGNRQIQNFKDILEFKKANTNNVILLFGNHDYHYIKGIGETYSGYQAGYALDIGEVVENAINDGLVQMCYLHDKFFFSHAGLTKTWVKLVLAPNNINPLVNEVMVQTINDYLKYQPRVFGFTMGERFSNTGDDVTQGPIWVRPYSLAKDMVEEIICVVGHTQVRELTIAEEDRIILIDCLDRRQYLSIQDGQPKMESLPI